MPSKYTNKLSDDDILVMVRVAIQGCTAAGIYPSDVNIRKHGARGGSNRIILARDQLLALGEPVISLGNRQHVGRRAKKNVPATIPPEPKPRYSSPVWADVVVARAAWKRLHRKARAVEEIPCHEPTGENP